VTTEPPALRYPGVAGVVVGARSPGEIEQDVELLGHPIPEELWDEAARRF
jgi:hypothetical protein